MHPQGLAMISLTLACWFASVNSTRVCGSGRCTSADANCDGGGWKAGDQLPVCSCGAAQPSCQGVLPGTPSLSSPLTGIALLGGVAHGAVQLSCQGVLPGTPRLFSPLTGITDAWDVAHGAVQLSCQGVLPSVSPVFVLSSGAFACVCPLQTEQACQLGGMQIPGGIRPVDKRWTNMRGHACRHTQYRTPIQNQHLTR
jgi:hypothetical protein